MYLLKAKKERDESNMLSCSVHTTVTLKWRISVCVRAARALARRPSARSCAGSNRNACVPRKPGLLEPFVNVVHLDISCTI